MKTKGILAAIMLATVLLTQSACTNQTSGTESASMERGGQTSEKTVMTEFERLTTQDNPSLKDIAAFIETNIKYVSHENASEIILRFEQLQKSRLPTLEQEFFNNTVQEKLQKEQDPNLTEEIKDAELRALIAKTRESGFKVETAEGMYYPVIDYAFYQTFTPFATEDIRSYINFMQTESDQPPAKDAALVISFDEILSRAQVLERFINAYPNSKKIEDIKALYNKYVAFTLLGSNNTPLFDYETKTLRPDAKKAYETAIKESSDSAFIQMLKGFMEVVQKNEYKLTDEVDKYRKKRVEG